MTLLNRILDNGLFLPLAGLLGGVFIVWLAVTIGTWIDGLQDDLEDDYDDDGAEQLCTTLRADTCQNPAGHRGVGRATDASQEA